jgi:hypothetical protein
MCPYCNSNSFFNVILCVQKQQFPKLHQIQKLHFKFFLSKNNSKSNDQ